MTGEKEQQKPDPSVRRRNRHFDPCLGQGLRDWTGPFGLYHFGCELLVGRIWDVSTSGTEF